MKQLNTKLVRILLIAACAFYIPFMTVKAQRIENAFFPSEMRWVSIAMYDSFDNPTDSAVYTWTQKGFPFVKEVYGWEDGKYQFYQSSKIVSDTGNDFAFESTMHLEGEDEEIAVRVEIGCNSFGEPLKMKTTANFFGMDMTIIEITGQYWHGSNSRLDSTLLTTSSMLGINASVKTKYTGYNADGRPTLIESFTEPGSSYDKTNITYFKNASGKLGRQESVSYEYYSQGGELREITKTITWFDAKERPVREEAYIATSSEDDDFELESYAIFYYDVATGIANFDLLAQPVIVSKVDECLSVNSPKAETIAIYSLLGAPIYTGNKAPGETQISISNFPHGIYFVTGSSGWVKKIRK